MGRVIAAVGNGQLAIRALTATAIAVGLWLVAWGLSYLTPGEGALREVMASRVPADLMQAGPTLALSIFSWNVLFGVGSIVIASLFALGPLSIGYLAPWWWALGYGVALGTNSFVLTVPGAKLAPRIDILWSHVGPWEILAYILIAAALANVHVWRSRRDLKVSRIRAFSEVRLRRAELACLAGALALLAFTANAEAASVLALLK